MDWLTFFIGVLCGAAWGGLIDEIMRNGKD